MENNDVLVNGSFDVNIWYSYDNDTKTNVVNDTISYNDLISIKIFQTFGQLNYLLMSKIYKTIRKRVKLVCKMHK